eukprot:s589_g14.t2
MAKRSFMQASPFNREKKFRLNSSSSPIEVLSGAPSAEGRGQIMGRRTFRAGDQAFYWSATHRCWLKTCVLSVNSDGDKSETYNLDCKSKVESWQMRTVDEPRDGPPDCSEGAGGGFAVGMPVQCFNQQKRVWEDGIVVRRYQQDKIIVFDVDCKESLVRMLPASRLRLSRFTVGDKVEYWSMNAKSWLAAKDSYGEQHDASNMTWAWWKANVKDAQSKIDVTCKKCGHRSKSTSLDSLQRGGAPGCFCNGGVRWSGREGRARCLSMLKDRCGEQHDARNMTWAWWKANVKDAQSKIDVTCKKCGHRSKSTSLIVLQRGCAPGCFCNGGVRWSSREGRARCLSMLKDRHGEQHDASNMTWAWWKANIMHQNSKIDVTCKKCGQRSKSTSLDKLQRGCAPGCFCNGGVRWSSREGRARCLSILKDRYGEQHDASNMTWAWWKANIMHQKSKIDVTCKKCGHHSKSTSLDGLQSGCAPGFFCNGGVRWTDMASSTMQAT